jgi:hypothetical protein
MKKLLITGLLLLTGYAYINNQHSPALSGAPDTAAAQSAGYSDAVIADAFSNHESNLEVTGEGVVVKLLPDDRSGSRHQKFIIKMASGQTLLVAHNIDLAPRISSIREGDTIQFKGEYEWNEKGGVLHWTHRDPNGSHPAGWIKYQGQTYQ